MKTREAVLGVMLSGTGRTLENLLGHIRRGSLRARLGLVVASRECRGAQIARDAGVPVVVEPGRIAAQRLESLLLAHDIDLVVLAGYLQLVSVPRAFRGRVVNMHPALLPDFGGPGMFGRRVHEAVLAAGKRETGCTVHLCGDEYDTGPIVLQKTCPVLPGDTPDTLAARVFDLECQAYPEALGLLIRNLTPPQAGARA
ncbi:MAG: phosphoribosylglycinamide formyltransferase [Phycisphaerales bacterium]